MADHLFCFLNYCGKMYAVAIDEHSGTDQSTGEYMPTQYHIKEIKGNIQQGTNKAININLSNGETQSADKSLYTYYKLDVNTIICIMPPLGLDGNPEWYRITKENTATYFMYRIIGELRYNYDLEMLTSTPVDLSEFLTQLKQQTQN